MGAIVFSLRSSNKGMGGWLQSSLIKQISEIRRLSPWTRSLASKNFRHTPACAFFGPIRLSTNLRGNSAGYGGVPQPNGSYSTPQLLIISGRDEGRPVWRGRSHAWAIFLSDADGMGSGTVPERIEGRNRLTPRSFGRSKSDELEDFAFKANGERTDAHRFLQLH